jgi:hypothetical protein
VFETFCKENVDDDRSDGVVPALACRPGLAADLDGPGNRPQDPPEYLAPALAAGLTPGKGGKFDEALWRELIAG